MPEPLYSDLDKWQKELLCNGCGSKGFKVPDLLFLEPCNIHDFRYWIGGNEQDRRNADWEFFMNMLAISWKQLRWFRYLLLSWVYYRSVRKFSRPFFSYRPIKRSWPELADLRKEIEGVG